MRLEQIAEKIPAEYRREILQLDMVNKAQAIPTDATMIYLGKIWQEYVDSGYTADCNQCCGGLLKNYKKLVPIFIEIEKNNNLLQSA